MYDPIILVHYRKGALELHARKIDTRTMNIQRRPLSHQMAAYKAPRVLLVK